MATRRAVLIGILASLGVWAVLGATTTDRPRFVRLHLNEKAQKLVIVNTAQIAVVIPERRGGSWVFVSGARTFEVHEPPEAIAALMR